MSLTAVETSAVQLVVLSLGGEEYALPIARVQEIIRSIEPRAVDSSVHWLRGVISLRGKIIPVCDLAARLGLGHEQVDGAKIVIIDTDTGSAGVIVDEVDEVLTVAAEQLEAVPGGCPEFIQAVAKVGDRLIVLLDPESMLAGVDSAAADELG